MMLLSFSMICGFSIPMVIVTDLTAQVQFRKIVYFGLDHRFDFVVTRRG